MPLSDHDSDRLSILCFQPRAFFSSLLGLPAHFDERWSGIKGYAPRAVDSDASVHKPAACAQDALKTLRVFNTANEPRLLLLAHKGRELYVLLELNVLTAGLSGNIVETVN